MNYMTDFSISTALYYFFFNLKKFWPCQVAYRILVPQPQIKLVSPAVQG